MFNQEWRDLLLAFFISIKGTSSTIQMNFSSSKQVELPVSLLAIDSDFGYNDPVKESLAALQALVENQESNPFSDEDDEGEDDSGDAESDVEDSNQNY